MMMVDKIKIWWHHFINPHCVECKFEANEKYQRERNLVIEEYRELLASARLEIGRLTQALVDVTKPPEIINQTVTNDFKPLARKMRMNELADKLTRESAEEAHRLRTNKINQANELRTNEVEKLESEIGVN